MFRSGLGLVKQSISSIQTRIGPDDRLFLPRNTKIVKFAEKITNIIEKSVQNVSMANSLKYFTVSLKSTAILSFQYRHGTNVSGSGS